MSYYAPVCIFVKSDSAVDGFGLNCLAWDQAPHWGNKTKKNKIGERSKQSGSQEKGKGNRGSTVLSPSPVHCLARLFPHCGAFSHAKYSLFDYSNKLLNGTGKDHELRFSIYG